MTVSVIVPVFNGEEYLHRCVESIRSQIWDDCEIILVNDGSTDRTDWICYELNQKDSRIRVFKQAHHGVAAARNLGMEKALGEWLLFVDADDWVVSGLQCVLGQLKKALCDFVVFDTMRTEEESKIKVLPNLHQEIKLFPVQRQKLIPQILGYKEQEVGWNLQEVWGKVYRKAFLKEHHIVFEEGIAVGEDVLFNVNVYLHSLFYGYVDVLGYCYFQHPESVMHQKRTDYVSNDQKYFQQLFQLLTRHRLWKDCEDAYYFSVLNGLAVNMNHCFFSVKNAVSFQDRRKAVQEMLNEDPYRDALQEHFSDVKKHFSIGRRLVLGLLRYQRIGMVDLIYKLR